jgi:hypothetical protein
MEELDTLQEIATNRPDITDDVETKVLTALDTIEETLVRRSGDVPHVFVKIDQRWLDVIENGWDNENGAMSADIQQKLSELENQIE